MGPVVATHELWGEDSVVMAHRLSLSVPYGIIQTRDQTHVPCTDRWILNLWAAREVSALAL